MYDNYYDENDSLVESDNYDNSVAESEDDADDVVVVHYVDIEYDSSEEEEWADKTLSYGSDCGYFFTIKCCYLMKLKMDESTSMLMYNELW